MEPYLELLREVREHGTPSDDRTGTGTLSVFGRQLRFDLAEGFPAVTTKRLYFKGVAHELLWFLQGATNLEYLQRHDVHIWDEWAGEDGELGPIYGKQWRSWEGTDGRVHDQIRDVIDQIQQRPNSRRHIVSAWKVDELDEMALPPCHLLFQFYVRGGRLSCQLYQRSADLFLGVPFNIASYALLTHMIAQVCGLEIGEFVHTFGDAHIYSNHIDQVDEQLRREPFGLPELRLNPKIEDIDAFTYEDIELQGYEHHPAIRAPIAV